MSNGSTVRTGPKTSFWTISLSWATVGDDRRPVEGPAGEARDVRARAADDDPGAGRLGPLDEALDPLDLGLVDERPKSVDGSNGSPTRTASNSSAVRRRNAS